MKRLLSLLICTIVLASTVACSSKRAIDGEEINCLEKALSKKELKFAKDTGELNYNWIKIKTDIYADIKGESYSFTASFRIRKDSLIWCSIAKAGIPVAKLKITKDSVKLVDLFNHKYKIGSINELEKLANIPLNLASFQRVLLSEFYINDSEKFKTWKKGNSYIISNRSRLTTNKIVKKQEAIKKPIDIQWVNCHNLKLKKMYFQSPEGKRVFVEYDKLYNYNNVDVFKEIIVRAFEQNVEISNIKVIITRLKAFDKLKVAFEIPSDYVEMD